MGVELYEVFFRDGSYALDFGFTKKHMRIIGAAMEKAGFRFAEVGHGYGLGAARAGYPEAAETDETYLKTASEVFHDCRFGAFYIPGVGTSDDLEKAADYGISFVSIGQNITQIEQAQTAVAHAKRLSLKTTVCLMKAHVPAPKDFGDKVKIVNEWEPDYIMIMDSAGNMTPEETADRTRIIRDAGKAGAGFHGHDNLSLAAANALTALKNGAERIDASLGGFGRSGGNAATEVVIALMERKGFFIQNITTRLDDLEPVIEAVRKAKIDLPNAPDMTDLLLGLYGLHSSIAAILNETAGRFGLPRANLYKGVAVANPVNPTREEIINIAENMTKKRGAYRKNG